MKLPQWIKELVILAMGIGFGVIIHGSLAAWNYKEPEPVIVTEYKVIEAEPEIITETEIVYVPYEEPFYRNFTEEDKWYLKDIAMREAGSESVIGQAMVMYVVINRAEVFNQSIKQVCESDAFKSSAFATGATPNQNCNEAFALIEEGWEPKPLYFRAGHYHTFGTPLFQVGNHYFSSK